MYRAIRIFFVILLIVIEGILISTNLSCSKPAAQKYVFNHPESVVYDEARARYIISNVEGKNILIMDKDNKLSLFAKGLLGPKGLVIRKDVIYAADVNAVAAFSLSNGKLLWRLRLPGSKFPNDTEVNDTHYLFCSDSDADIIYRIDLDTQNIEEFKDPALSKPNGILWDAPNKRLLIVSLRDNSPIQALDWDNHKIITLMKTTFSSLDGFTRDKVGNYYITSWGTKSVFKIAPDFTGEPMLVKDGFNGPADICYNPIDNILVLPIMMENRIEILGIK